MNGSECFYAKSADPKDAADTALAKFGDWWVLHPEARFPQACSCTTKSDGLYHFWLVIFWTEEEVTA